MPSPRRSLILLVLAAAVGLLAGCPPARVSRSDEIRIGQRVAREIESQYRTYDDPMVTRIGRSLAAVSDRPDLPYRFRVIDRPEINAVSLPGGPVYLYEGLLRATGNDPQMLAGVLAHEVGHIAERHAARQIERQQWFGLGIAVLTGRGAARDIATIAANLQLLSFSRQQEYDADAEAIRYLRQAGFDPRGLVRFFDLVLSRERRGAEISWLRTHPTTEARRNRALELIRRQGRAKGSGQPAAG